MREGVDAMGKRAGFSQQPPACLPPKGKQGSLQKDLQNKDLGCW